MSLNGQLWRSPGTSCILSLSGFTSDGSSDGQKNCKNCTRFFIKIRKRNLGGKVVFIVPIGSGSETTNWEQITTPDDLCKPETTYFDGGENYGLALLKPDSFSLSLSFPTQCSSKSLPFNEVLWYRKEGRKEGRKFTRQRMTRYRVIMQKLCC
jgi:hypothetical protein